MADSKKLPSVFKNEKILKATIAVGLVAIAVIFLSDFIFGGDTSDITKVPAAETDLHELYGLYTENFEKQIESKLTDLLSKIDGVGEISVMVTLDSAKEYIFAQEESAQSNQREEYSADSLAVSDSSGSSENSYILVDIGSGKKEALVKTVIQPKIRGVAVVCSGGDNPVIKEKVLETVSKVFGISTSKVCVTK